RLFGEDLGHITERRARRLRRRMGVCGGPLELDPDLTVADNLALPCQLKGLSRKQIHSRIERIAQTMEIEELLTIKVRRLGFVERRTVSLARALAHDPELALLEAPLVGLPTPLRAILISVLQRLAVTGAAVVVFNEESGELETGAPDNVGNDTGDMDIFSE
ncbi:MAG TPA: ATP-binding cassette domain-containing protein, partial [candidate division Zixibacteria bacterium]|nr:ATP-binding cassette domain-containing protein [candidate division Zixibacteria bacterium]